MLLKTPSVWKLRGFFCADAPKETSAQNAQSKTIRNKTLIGFSFLARLLWGRGRAALLRRPFVKAPSANSLAFSSALRVKTAGIVKQGLWQVNAIFSSSSSGSAQCLRGSL